MDIKAEIINSKKIYSEEWGFTSEFYHKNNYYSMLASKLPNGTDTLLEIGSGLGFSTLALSDRANQIISIEENSFCVEKTFQLLQENSKNVKKTLRGLIQTEFKNIQEFSYQMNYDRLLLDYNTKIHCVEGDILVDTSLLSALQKMKEATDVITCWMIGAHGLILNEEKQQLKGRNSVTRTSEMIQGYKLDVIEQTAKVASSLLRNKGILSVVERVNLDYIDQFEHKEILNLYNVRIQPFGFELKNDFDVTIIDSVSQMQMVSTKGIIQPSKLGLLYLEYEITNANKK